MVEFQLYVRKVIVQTLPREWCLFNVDGMWTSTMGGVSLMWTGGRRRCQNLDFLVDIINSI